MKIHQFLVFAATVSLLTINFVTQVKAAQFTFTVINETGKDINDYHAVISGTGGTITNPMLLLPDLGSIDSGQINAIPASQNPFNLPTDIIINFSNSIPSNNKFSFKFDTQFNFANIEGQVFTFNGKPVDSPKQIPEPFTIIGTLIGGTVAFYMRSKLKFKITT
jgi:hypothetical protein